MTTAALAPASEPRGSSAGALLAGGLPVLLWIATASGYASGPEGALDDALGLAFSHPLSALLAQLCALWPMGPLSLRAALGSALAIALAAVSLQRMVSLAIAPALRADPGLGAMLGVAAGWAFAGHPAVYALATTPTVAVAALPLAVLALERAARAQAAAELRLCALAIVASAVEQPLVGAVTALVALAVLRRRGRLGAARRSLARGVAVGLGCAIVLGATTDLLAAGYRDALATSKALAPACGWALCVVLSASAVAWAITHTRAVWLARLCVGVALLAALILLRASSLDAYAIAHQTSDTLTSFRLRLLQARNVLLLSDASAHRLADLHREQALRPDVRVLRLSLLEQPAAAGALEEFAPELAPLMRETLLEGGLPVAALQSLATLLPLSLELGPRQRDAVRQTLRPEGPWFAASSSALTPADLELAGKQQWGLHERLHATLDLAQMPAPDRDWLLSRVLTEAHFYAVLGQLEMARALLHLWFASASDPLFVAQTRNLDPDAREVIEQAYRMPPPETPKEPGPRRRAR